ncbi:MAG: BolA family transcriptional regulator [Bdellovibrionales bacterium]|nr:BolA family transcriptional regulator [Bdellovibrionales bacterium]
MQLQGSRQSRLEHLLRAEFQPVFLNVINESHSHSVPENSETHFRVELVSKTFKDLGRLARSRKVHVLVAEEFAEGLHALSLQLYTPEEWEKLGEQSLFGSPACRGGSRTS